MVNLQDTCCLDISLDLENNSLVYGDGVYPSNTHRVPLANLLPVLLNKSLAYPKYVYEEHMQVCHETDKEISNYGISFDLVTMPAGLLGIEFVKTHVYYSPTSNTKKYSCVVEVHHGTLTIIMQKNAPKDPLDFDTHIEEGIVINLNKGDKTAVPHGYFYTFINTGNDQVVFTKVFKKNSVIDYNVLKKESGLAYYCIRKNAKAEIVLNPMYKDTPRIEEIAPLIYWNQFSSDVDGSLYQLLRLERDLFIKNLWE